MSKFGTSAPSSMGDGLAHVAIKDNETGAVVGYARIQQHEVSAFQVALASGADLDTTVYDLDSLVQDQDGGASQQAEGTPDEEPQA